VVREILEVKNAVASVFSSNTLIYFNAEIVLDRLIRCDAVYFVCYGMLNYIDPFDSFFIFLKNILTGLMIDKLTVR